MHTMKNYAVNMSKLALSVGGFGVALAGGLLMSGWLAIHALVFFTNAQM